MVWKWLDVALSAFWTACGFVILMEPPLVGTSATGMVLTPLRKNNSMGNSLGGRDADQADRAWPGELVDISSKRLTQGMPINQELKYAY